MSATMTLRCVRHPTFYRLEALSSDTGGNAMLDYLGTAQDLTSGGAHALPNVAQRLADNSGGAIAFEAETNEPFDF